MKSRNLTSYTVVISDSERAKLREIISSQSEWEFGNAPYAFWKASKTGTSIVAFESGKLTIQGKGTEDFVLFTLEPQVTGKALLNYSPSGEHLPPADSFDNSLPLPHIGIDESGKGDFFGPLVISAVFVDEKIIV